MAAALEILNQYQATGENALGAKVKPTAAQTSDSSNHDGDSAASANDFSHLTGDRDAVRPRPPIPTSTSTSLSCEQPAAVDCDRSENLSAALGRVGRPRPATRPPSCGSKFDRQERAPGRAQAQQVAGTAPDGQYGGSPGGGDESRLRQPERFLCEARGQPRMTTH